MAQMNAQVDSPLTALDETLVAVQRLLRGEEVTTQGRYVSLDGVALDAPPTIKPPVSAGVRGPKSLEVAGRVADGTIMADFVSADYIRWAKQHIGSADHRITVFASLAVAHDGDDARQAMSYLLAEVAPAAPISLRMAPFWSELEERAERVGWLDAVQAMPAEWWAMIAPVGTPDDGAAYVESLADAGADAVTFFPNPSDAIADGAFAAAELLPLLR
jgi:alkanesulfonate monooxygenase SsuD/methylene tetrahydromethanopterin reductase-like flavin-dependent oxidoreductase (luciferase family)